MTLSERLKKKQVKSEQVTIDGDVYVISGMSGLTHSQLLSQARSKKKDLSIILLANLVSDEAGTKASYDEWAAADNAVCDKLIQVINKLCYGDTGISDPKN